MLENIDEEENLAKMQAGELYYCFTPQLVAARQRCSRATRKLNNADELTRRQIAEIWKEITNDSRPLPPPGANDAEEDAVLHEYPWIEPPMRLDYGINVKVGSNVFINHNCVMIDTSPITIGSRTLFGPNVHVYSGGHPTDPEVRNGTLGPEFGKPVSIGEDCWIGGNVTILPGDVPPYHVVAGNPARIIRKLQPKTESG
ncbi:trimeric LpxA-like protein [Stachybotrys elegans]|uniref:Trimeric LpxA-like protein n=1 Tax=Stachybotrys elegans TaxID=80388 RepID=A0A8K0SSL8_9HYPO|nr:trimeric LpxA-like protein [Stachybotrys elegans]